MSKDATRPALSTLLRYPDGTPIADLDAGATPGYPGKGKDDAPKLTEALAPQLSDLQELLFAAGRSDADAAHRVLIVLQGLDTSGKGGVIRHAIGLVDPQGVDITSFKVPTAEERAHHYLWRIERALPKPGMIGIFDRSHYEDVLVVRVENLVEPDVWGRRYDEINAWEADLVEQGYTLIKCWLNVSRDEQKARLLERLDNPEKHWKYSPGDVTVRGKWDAYLDAYQAVLRRCSTDAAPWYVIPSDRKWYRNWAVAELLREKLAGLGLTWPVADFDVDAERRRVEAS